MRLIHSDCNIATSGANSYPIESANLNLDLQTYSSPPRTSLRNTLATPVSIPVTFTTANTFMGMYMCIARVLTATSSNNITVDVKKNGASQGSKTFAYNDVCAHLMQFYYFDLASLNITTSAGDTWTVEYSFPESTVFPSICRGAGGVADFFYAVCTNANTTNLANGEELLIKQGVTFNQEQSFTMATNTQKRGIFLGRDAIFTVVDGASPITLTAPSRVVMLGGKVLIGTSDTPISAAGRFTWDASSMTAGYQLVEGTSYSNGTFSTTSIKMYGAGIINTRIRLTQDTAVGANVFNVDTDVSASWQVGDTIVLAGKNQGVAEGQTFTIASMTATTITTNENVATNKYLKGAAVVDVSRTALFGVVINGCGGGFATGSANGNYSSANEFTYNDFVLHGVGIVNCPISVRQSGLSGTVFSLENVISYYSLSTYYSYAHIVMYSVTKNARISDVHIMYKEAINVLAPILSAPQLTIDKFTWRNSYTGFQMTMNNGSINDMVCSNAYNTGGASTDWALIKFTGAKLLITNSWFNGGTHVVSLIGAVGAKIENTVINGGRNTIYGTTNASTIELNNCDLGVDAAPTVAQVSISADAYHEITFNACNFNAPTLVDNIANAYSGTFVRSVTHNETAGDNRSWYVEGKFVSDGDTIEATNTDTTNTLINQYNLSTGIVAANPIRLSVKSNILNANYYGGTHINPTLEVEYDGGTEVTAVGTDTVDEESLVAAFTPTTSNNNIAVRLKQQSDAITEEDREVAYYDLGIVMRPYGYLETNIQKELTKTTDDIFADVVVGAVDPVITETDKTTVAAYTGIAVNHAGEEIAVTSAHTAAELYDYCQYDLGLEDNLDKAKFFYSVDGGLSFNSAYDLSISGGNVTTTKTLRMGTGKVHISNGAYWTGPIDGDVAVTAPGDYVLKLDGNTVDFTTAGTYSFSGSTIGGTVTLTNSSGGAVTLTVDDASKFTNTGPNITLAAPPVERGQTFTGLIAGSQVKVFATGTDTEIFSDNNSSTSESWDDATGGEITVDYVIQKAGYHPIRVTGITLTGATSGGIQSVPISQQVDRSYVASSGLTINTNAFANASTKKFGLSTASTLQNFYSYMIEQWIALGDSGEAFANQPFPLESNGPNSFSLKAGWEWDTTTYPNSITDLSRDGMRYLDTDGNVTAIWSAILTAGVPSGARVRYQQTDGGTTAEAAVTSGNMDELVQVYGDSTHGNFDYREYLVLKVQEMGYDQVESDVIAAYGNLEDQLYVIGLAPTANTVATGDPGITGVTITDHAGSPVTWNSKVFSITITDSGTNSGEDIMKWLRYNFEQGGTFQGKDAFNWHDLVQQNGSAFKTVRGKVYGDTGAALKGVRVLRGTEAHPDFTLFTADDGTTYAPPTTVVVSLSGFASGTRIQIYDTANSASLFNGVVSATTKVYTETYSVDRTIRVRASLKDGVTAKDFVEANLGTVTSASPTVSRDLGQEDDDVYNANAVDGSLVTGITFTDAATDIVNVDISAGTVTWQQIYAAFVAWMYTEEGIADDIAYVEAVDTANYKLTSMKIKNTSSPSVPLEITGGYGVDATTGASVDLVDTTGGTLIFAPDHVVAKIVTVGGANVITGDIGDIAPNIAAIKAKTDFIPSKTVASKLDIESL